MSARQRNGVLGAAAARHASELTGGFLVAVAVTLVLGIAFAIVAGLQHAPAPGVPGWLPDAVRVPSALDAAARFGWSVHAVFVVLGAIGLGQFVWGNGVRPNSLVPNHPSVYYTLSLPVRRSTLVWSRYAFAAGGAAALMALMLVIDAVVLWAFGHAVPLGEMAAVSLAGFCLLCAVVAAYGFLGIISDHLAAWFLVVGLLCVMAFAWTPVLGFIAAAPFPARSVGVLAIAAGLVLATAYLAERRDF